jgi:hypothetical protein
MPGLVPGIHALLEETSKKEDVDGRDKPGHDVDGLGSFDTPCNGPSATRRGLRNLPSDRFRE